jgi:uncharacterized damage-inducible protein DinB
MDMTPNEASVILDFLFPQIEQETETTKRVMSRVPEDKADYKPADACMSARELTAHVASSDIWFLEGILNGAFANPDESGVKNKPIAELVAMYESKMPGLTKRLKELPAEDLAKPLDFYGWILPRVSYIEVMQRHMIHHRGQLSSYLRPMGAKVPNIYGGSLDEPMQMTTEAKV